MAIKIYNYICDMSLEQIKIEIHKAIDNVPDHELPQLLDHINSVLEKYPTKEEFYKNVNRIFKEDDGLLRRLAG
jgi:hypothetical protein